MDEARIRELLDFCEAKRRELQANLEEFEVEPSFHDKHSYTAVTELRDRTASVFPDVWQQIPRPDITYPSESYSDAFGYLGLVAQRCREALEPTVAAPPASPTTNPAPPVDAETAIAAGIAAMMDDEAIKVHQIAASRKSADQRMREIAELDTRYIGFSAPQWVGVLSSAGKISDAAVRQTDCWKEWRKEEKGGD